MYNISFRRVMIFAVMILFLSSVLTPITFSQNSSYNSIDTLNINLGTTLYVGGMEAGNYSSIQSAINDANNGDTVFIYDDSSPYYERFTVNKQINISSNSKDTTLVV